MGHLSYAHAPNEAFFDIFESQGNLIIQVEFPWTIRKALLQAAPHLEQAQTQSEMEAGLLDYLKQNIQILDQQKKAFQLLSLVPIPNTSNHGHGTLYQLNFDHHRPIHSIQNSTMFNSYPKQINYHTLHTSKGTIKFTTNQQQPSYLVMDATTSPSNGFFYTIITGLISVGIGLFLKRKKRPTV